jgi:reactive intermediate/imine deaminase
MMRTSLTLIFLLPLLATAAERRVVVPANAPKPVGPYSPGIAAGGYLYASGQGARDPSGKMTEGIEAQTRQTLLNIRAIMEAGGLTMEHIVYSQVYLADVSQYDGMDKVWREVFPSNAPARAVLGVKRMPTETPVEISAVAVLDLKNKRRFAGGVATPERIYLDGISAADPQTAMDLLQKTLHAEGISLGHLVFTNVYLNPGLSIAAMNKVYAPYFEKGNAPARATIAVNALPHGAQIEITGVAVRNLANRRVVRPRNMAPSATASPCVWSSDTLYCSAKSGFIPGANSGIYSEDVETQVRQTMRNLLDGLEESGIDFSHVVASNVYLDQLDEFARMNGIYGKYFSATPPTRTTVQPAAAVERHRDAEGRAPMAEQISIVAVR